MRMIAPRRTKNPERMAAAMRSLFSEVVSSRYHLSLAWITSSATDVVVVAVIFSKHSVLDFEVTQERCVFRRL